MNGLHPEDYLEPGCIFCRPEDEQVTPVDLRRCLDRLDSLLERNDTAAARRHLDYWRQEALAGRDWRGLLSIENERMGLLRKLGDEDAALASAEEAQALIRRAGLENTVTAGTTLLNVGTVLKRFGRSAEALPCYEQAREIYLRELAPGDCRFGGLWNNMALVLADLGRRVEARQCYEQALAVMKDQPNGALECAVTELNLADLAEAELGLLEAEAEIETRLDRAMALLDRPELPRNGYYAFVCDKCASVFGYYGRFLDAQMLKARAEAIYAGA